MVFCGSALLHVAFDFPLHNYDARQHFWPLADWVILSPLSYWDNAHYGRIVGFLEGLACAVLLVVLWIRFKGPGARILVAGIGTLQRASRIIWSILLP